jgi:CrcB protein
VTIVLWTGVALLGAFGAVLRLELGSHLQTRAGGDFPVGTLAVNLTGALALGVLTGAGVGGDALLLAGTAFIGAYTTFSTWMLEEHDLGLTRAGVAYLVLSLAGGLACTGAGWALGSLL